MLGLQLRQPYSILLVLVLMVVVGFAVGYYRTSKDLTIKSPVPPPGPVVHEVALLIDRAEPNVVQARVGDFVQFNSNDGRQHEIAEGKGNDFEYTHDHPASGLQSGIFGADEGYKVEFKKSGVYYFHDNVHPEITVTVIAYIPEEK